MFILYFTQNLYSIIKTVGYSFGRYVGFGVGVSPILRRIQYTLLSDEYSIPFYPTSNG